MNLSKQGDVMNARASRTTHPKTLGLLKTFYRLFDDSFDIVAPYYNKTKAEIVTVFNTYDEKEIIASSVSCSSTRTKAGQVPHCGCCSQCIDRRFSLYAAGLDQYDAPYASYFEHQFLNDEIKQRIIITLRLACMEEISTKQAFLEKFPTDTFDIVEHWHGSTNPEVRLDEVYSLVGRYGESVLQAATRMRNKYDDIRSAVNKDSLLGLIADREYLRSPFAIRVSEIDLILRQAIPDMYQQEPPKNENDFNANLHAILGTTGKFTREYPVLLFGLTSYRADQAQDGLILESKYLRGDSMTPSRATEDIAADITKIPLEYGLLFVVYDPERKITDDIIFAQAFESKRKDCFVRIYR